MCDLNGSCRPPYEGDVRLVSMSSIVTQREGTVQICINGTWGTICNYGWDSRDAGVVCSQLGLASLGKQHAYISI